MQSEPIPTAPSSSHRPIWLFLSGLLMGSADIVPGVSGGTMAFILGIYEDLLDAVHNSGVAALTLVRTRLREGLHHIPWKFILPLGLGIGVAIFSLAEGLHWLLETHPTFIWSFFFGLVLGSVIVVRKRIPAWQPAHLLLAAAFSVSAFLLVGLIPVNTPDTPLYLFLSGALAICAMILPGISGAFILVLLGKYDAVLRAVISLDLLTLGLVGAGAVAGLLSLARVLRWTFNQHRDWTIAALVGLMLGSLRKLWPWKSFATLEDGFLHEINLLPSRLDGEVLGAVQLALAGFGVVLLIEALAKRRQPTDLL